MGTDWRTDWRTDEYSRNWVTFEHPKSYAYWFSTREPSTFWSAIQITITSSN
jgi:hypothetical protein